MFSSHLKYIKIGKSIASAEFSTPNKNRFTRGGKSNLFSSKTNTHTDVKKSCST